MGTNMEKQELTNKTVLVTGSAQRIGRAIVLGLAKAGINVVIHYNTSSNMAAETVEQSISYGVKAWKFQADLSRRDDVENLIPYVMESAGTIHFLINNAAIFPESSLQNLTLEDFYHTLNVNTVAPLILSRQFAHYAQKGAIINILDSRIKRYDTNHVSYLLSKNMLYTLTKLMAIEFSPKPPSIAASSPSSDVIVSPSMMVGEVMLPVALRAVAAPEILVSPDAVRVHS